MRVDWTQFDNLDTDRLWLRPLGLISGRAAAAAIAAGHARPLSGPNLAFTAIAAMGLAPGSRLVMVSAPFVVLETWISGAGARFAARARAQLTALSASPATWAGFVLDRALVISTVDSIGPEFFGENEV